MAIDRKIGLDEIAQVNDMSMPDLLEELDGIVQSGTKLRLDYYLNKAVDEYVRDTVIEYFKEAESDSIDDAFAALKDDEITWEEIQLMRLKFLSDYAN